MIVGNVLMSGSRVKAYSRLDRQRSQLTNKRLTVRYVVRTSF